MPVCENFSVFSDAHGGVAARALMRADLAEMHARMFVTYAALYGAVFDELSRRELLAQIQDLHAMMVQPAN
jgi:hypothetical protein